MHFPKILICTDFSEASKNVFELAAYEEKMEGSQITLLNVYSVYEPGCLNRVGDFPTNPVVKDDDEYEKKIKDQLTELAKENFKTENVQCEAIVTRKDTAETICEYATSNDYNVIIVGSRGHTALGALFLGSVAQRILLLSKIPVLVIPPEK